MNSTNIILLDPTFESSDLITEIETLYKYLNLYLVHTNTNKTNQNLLPNQNNCYISNCSDHALVTAVQMNNDQRLMRPALISKHKELQRSIPLDHRKVRHPASLVIEPSTTQSSIKAWFQANESESYIVKPESSSGSQGASKTSSHCESLAYLPFAQSHSPNGKVLIESLIFGEHYIVDVIGDDMIVGKKNKSSDLILTSSIIFEKLTESYREHIGARLIEACKEIIDKFGFNPALKVTAEFICAADGSLYLIEAANRGAGVNISSKIFSAIFKKNTERLFLLNWLNFFGFDTSWSSSTIQPPEVSSTQKILLEYVNADHGNDVELSDCLFYQALKKTDDKSPRTGVFNFDYVKASWIKDEFTH